MYFSTKEVSKGLCPTVGLIKVIRVCHVKFVPSTGLGYGLYYLQGQNNGSWSLV